MEQEKMIRELFAKYVTYWNNHDIKNWGKLFTNNTKFITWSGVMYSNNTQNIKQHRNTHRILLEQNQNMTYNLNILNVSFLHNDIAIVYAAWDWKDFKIDDSQAEVRTGILTMLLLKENGAWLIRTTQNTRTAEGMK